MRVFVGIKTTPDFDNNVIEFQQNLTEQIRWIKSKNLHITLIPSWNEENINVAVQNLKKITLPIASTIIFNNLYFMPPHHPRMLWLGADATQELLELRIQVYKAFGKNIDKRVFTPHVTIARIKESKFYSKKYIHINDSTNIRMPIKNITLFHSRLIPEGAEYEVLEQISVS